MAASDTDGWIDITQEFKDACVELQVGELVHDVGFGLYEAMSAFEMMDPKMDSGIIDANSSKLPPKTFASCQASGELKLGIISHNECSDIVDGTLCCIASWLEGGSMAQTVFANLYLHNPFSIDDRVMRAVCVTVLKLVSVVKELITSTCVYEEDHFQPMTHGFQLADSITPQRVLGMMKEAEDDLGKRVRTLKAQSKESGIADDNLLADISSIDGLIMRVRFIKLFLSSLLMLKYTEGALVNDEQLMKSIEKMKETLAQMLSSEKGTLLEDPLSLLMFDVRATTRLLPPSFPRAVKLMSLESTLQMFSTICDQLFFIASLPKRQGLVDTMDEFDQFSHQQPSILIRSILLHHYLPVGTGKVYNKIRLSELVAEELRAYNAPPAVNPLFRSSLMSHEHVKLVMNTFFVSAAHVLEGLFAAKCNTRARQREKLAMLLEELGVLQSEAERADSIVDTILRDKLGEKDITHISSGVGTWTLYVTTRTMMMYLMLGMELELYDIREYCYFFWYMSEIILLWNTSSLFRAENSLAESARRENKAASTGGKKKAYSKHKKTVAKAANVHNTELLLARCQQHISGGLYKLIIALRLSDMLPTKGSYPYDDEQVRYTHRFAPFALVNFPQIVPYSSYVDAIGLAGATPPPYVTIDFLSQSFKNFETTLRMLESEQLKNNEEANSLRSVAKNNMVVTKILADSLQKEIKRAVKFDFTAHKVFPMIKFAT